MYVNENAASSGLTTGETLCHTGLAEGAISCTNPVLGRYIKIEKIEATTYLYASDIYAWNADLINNDITSYSLDGLTEIADKPLANYYSLSDGSYNACVAMSMSNDDSSMVIELNAKRTVSGYLFVKRNTWAVFDTLKMSVGNSNSWTDCDEIDLTTDTKVTMFTAAC